MSTTLTPTYDDCNLECLTVASRPSTTYSQEAKARSRRDVTDIIKTVWEEMFPRLCWEDVSDTRSTNIEALKAVEALCPCPSVVHIPSVDETKSDSFCDALVTETHEKTCLRPLFVVPSVAEPMSES